VQPALEAQVLAPCRLRIDRDPLADRTDDSPHLLGMAQDVDPRDFGVPSVGAGERGQDPDRRRLAGAVRAEEPEDRSRLDREPDAIDGDDRPAVALHQPVGDDGGSSILVHVHPLLLNRLDAKLSAQ
jgi:hypothetical protein